MKITKKLKKKYSKLSLRKRNGISALVALVIVIAIAIPLTNFMKGSHADSSVSLYTSPTSESVTVGSDVTISVILNPGDASLVTIQSVLSYNPADFSYVNSSSTLGNFVNTEASGSVTFTSATLTAITTTTTIATVTLQAIGADATSNVSLASVCGTGNYALTCSAAYDSVNGNNDLGSVAGSTYTINPIVPSTPVLSVGSQTTTSVTLTWPASTDANGTTSGPGILGYNIFENSSSTPLGGSTPTTTATTYTISGLTPNTKYNFTAQAIDKSSPAQISALSSAISVTTANPVPTAPTVSLIPTPTSGFTYGSTPLTEFTTATSIPIQWTAATDSGSTIIGYNIYLNGSTTPVGGTTPTTTSTSYNITGLTAKTAYTIVVKAVDNSSPANLSPATSADTLAASTYEVGAIDGSGTVEGHDLSLLIDNYGKNYPPAEYDSTTSVEGHDLSLLIDNYGK